MTHKGGVIIDVYTFVNNRFFSESKEKVNEGITEDDASIKIDALRLRSISGGETDKADDHIDEDKVG